MLIRELLAQKQPGTVICTGPENTLFELAADLRKHNIGAMLVTGKDGAVAGLVSERDLVRAVAEFGESLASRCVADIMTRAVVTCTPRDNVIDTLAVMNEKRIRHMPVLMDGKPHAMISIREFDHACRQLQIQSRTDELTGLANRRYFMETLDIELARGKRYDMPLSLALLDVDHFKHVNDTFGHDAGDRVLSDLAKVLVRELRTFDGIGRLGGEEFAILFPNTTAENAKKACQRLMAAIRAHEVVTDAGSIRFTASFGLTGVGPDTPDGRALLKAADKLLYQAKNEGRNRVVTRSQTPPCNPPAGVPGQGRNTAICEAENVLPYTAT